MFHLIDKKELDELNSGTWLINSSRGAVVSNDALMTSIPNKDIFTVLDVWEHEPNLNPTLANSVNLGTPHIAGYSFEGKINGTKLIYDAFCNHFNFLNKWIYPTDYSSKTTLNLKSGSMIDSFSDLFSSIYKIENDSNNLKQVYMRNFSNAERIKKFDELRKNYKLRREFCSYIINVSKNDAELSESLKELRFTLNINNK